MMGFYRRWADGGVWGEGVSGCAGEVYKEYFAAPSLRSACRSWG